MFYTTLRQLDPLMSSGDCVTLYWHVSVFSVLKLKSRTSLTSSNQSATDSSCRFNDNQTFANGRTAVSPNVNINQSINQSSSRKLALSNMISVHNHLTCLCESTSEHCERTFALCSPTSETLFLILILFIPYITICFLLNSSVFWVIMRRKVVLNRHICTTYRPHFNQLLLGQPALQDGTDT
jgi:hypothetical protein